MADYFRKVKQLEKKANYKNSQIELEFEFILDESNPKYHWNESEWMDYAFIEKKKGNKVIYLSNRFSNDDDNGA